MLCRAIPAVILFVIFNVHPLRAQTFRGAIQGTVIDASGSVVTRAQITVVSEDTNLARDAASDDSGDYLVTELPPGSYRVTAAVSGFQKQVVTGVYVEVAASSRVDLTLSPGQVTEIIEVAGVLPLLETFGNNQGSTMGARQASELPLNGRDFLKTMLLIPGATADPSSVSDAPGSFGTFSMNGSRGKSNNYLLDGIDMNDSYHNSPAINEPGVWGTPATLLPLDALAEIPVLSGVDAQFGRNSGAIVNLVTKSGTISSTAPHSNTFVTVPSTPATTSILAPFHKIHSTITSLAALSAVPSSRTKPSFSWPTRDSANTEA